jgi:hypothetical protein
MARALKLFVATLVVAMITAAAAVAGGGGAGNFHLLGPDGNAFCDGSGVISGSDGGFGFAIINAPGGQTVSTTVKLKKLDPNTVYSIRLVQGVADCFTFDATITTNKKGNGTVHWSEPSVSGTALVAVDGGGDAYVTETYFH